METKENEVHNYYKALLLQRNNGWTTEHILDTNELISTIGDAEDGIEIDGLRREILYILPYSE